MQEKKANKPRYWITYLLKDLEEGSTFKPDILHLTIIPWFVANKSNAEIIESFKKQFAQEKSFNVVINGVTEFKSRRKIPVNLVDPSPEIIALHKKALEWFSALEARWAVKCPYVGKEYIPHIRRRPGYNQSKGNNLRISSLSLVSANRRGDDLRTVMAKVNFNA